MLKSLRKQRKRNTNPRGNLAEDKCDISVLVTLALEFRETRRDQERKKQLERKGVVRGSPGLGVSKWTDRGHPG